MNKTNWTKLQQVDINSETVLCENCKADLLDLANFKYTGQNNLKRAQSEELCTCKKCGTHFLMVYRIYDQQGHIYIRVFSGDINCPSYNWQDVLSDVQKKDISEHIEKCDICKERLSSEILNDAWLGSIIKDLKKNTTH